ncbi:DUF1398 domain-containing protein [Novosphingobium album (ex Liu et al. 2023)]|uniref:DUF1398 family protein n=1 Tax=Novosphingobium album (ex Liu et al. 2023) TaxID=3031130 RepID=A0ABT5WLU2_9SPHN|nr:DUF1398 family protein [Novosphingobium album (ex Liu et al. 2023)]MDE8651010.1 DUF1398 family protein [Novosphingobium album (ex Liu et al. 2023)]
MDAERIAIAKACLDAAHDGSLSFPEIIGQLVGAGFEGYTVDYRRNSQTFYLPDGGNVELAMPRSASTVAAVFDIARVESHVRWAQANEADYSYAAFCEKVKVAGCAGYLVSFLGRRVVYFGRTAETHVELFPR